MTLRTLLGVLVSLAATFSTVLLPGGSMSIFAQAPSVMPGDVALTLEDLPPGFELEADVTRSEPLENFGLSYTTAMKIDPTPEHVSNGPVRVWQQVVRIDRLVVPADFFAEVRDRITAQEKLEPFPGGVNNATTVQLIGQTDADGQERVVYAVGRLRDNLIWFTLVGGASPGTTIQSAITLNNISLAKYERFRSTNGAPAIANSLFLAPFPTEELPQGFLAGNIVQSDISERAGAHNAVAEIDLQVEGPGPQNLITFIVYPSEVQARASFDEAPARAAERGSLLATPDGYGYPVLCAMRGGEIDGRKLGATSCVGLIGTVEVSALSVIENGSAGAMQDSLELMAAGVKHLQRVSANAATPP